MNRLADAADVRSRGVFADAAPASTGRSAIRGPMTSRKGSQAIADTVVGLLV